MTFMPKQKKWRNKTGISTALVSLILFLIHKHPHQLLLFGFYTISFLFLFLFLSFLILFLFFGKNRSPESSGTKMT